jgi:hypothetical protein
MEAAQKTMNSRMYAKIKMTASQLRSVRRMCPPINRSTGASRLCFSINNYGQNKMGILTKPDKRKPAMASRVALLCRRCPICALAFCHLCLPESFARSQPTGGGMKPLLIGSAFLFFVSSAHAIECRAELPSHHTTHWTYRILEGRKCWYEGKGMVSKALLNWSVSNVSAKPDPEPAASGQSASSFESEHLCCSRQVDGESFESRWQAIFGSSAVRR